MDAAVSRQSVLSCCTKTSTSQKIVLVLIPCIISVVLFIFYFQETNDKDHTHFGIVAQISVDEISEAETWKRISVINGTKNILLWKNSWGFRFEQGRAAFLNSGCRVTNCLITTNSSLMPHTNFDAFVIHPPTQQNPWILKGRRLDQMFVMFTTEPPIHMPNLDKFENFFNWTMTYRTGSTFQLKYGEIVALETSPSTEKEAELMRFSVAQSGLNPAEGKTKLVIWLVSNCNARSNRQGYVKILKKHIDVDIISKGGKCGGQDICPRHLNSDVCYDMIEKTYKFYLSFENSICKEYVTEKFFEMMGRNIVPVVMGGADYTTIAPPHSYINALDYTPKQLAEYLMELDRNDTLYAEYFWWKPHYRIRNLYDTNRQAFCDLCEALHTKPIQTSIKKGLRQWYSVDANCRHNPKFDES